MRRDRGEEYVRRLILKLYENVDYYFSNDELNSEGWKVFNEIVYYTLKTRPWYRRRIRNLRAKPSVENIFLFAREVYGVP